MQFSRRWHPAVPFRKVLLLLLLLLLTLCTLSIPAVSAQVFKTQKQSFTLRILTRGLENPWSVAFLPDSRMLITERPGRLRLVSATGELDPRSVQGLPSNLAERGQGGLLDVALHPRFEENGWVYLAYAAKGEGGHGTELARGRLKDYRLESVQVLFRALPKSSGGRHFGARIVFDNAGHLFLGLGERGDRPRAQDISDHAGSIVRLNDDGSVPADNPFIGRAGAQPELYSIGNRNVQGAALHPLTGELWAHEHGPQGGDELNVIRAGKNYGWPVITYGVNYVIGTRIGEGSSKAGMEQPLHYWVPSIAPSGMSFVTGKRFPGWTGDLLIGSLKFRQLVRLRLRGGKVVHEERMLEDALGRIRDVRQGPDGLIYLLSDDSDGVLARLEPTSR